MQPILEVSGLTKLYRGSGRGIRDVSLRLEAGDVYGLLGPNGAGKTTFLKLVTGLIRADGGTVTLFGVDRSLHHERAMENVGCMIESADVPDFLTAWQYLRQSARFYPELTGQRMEEVLDTVGLLHVRHEKIKGFSAGMKQKLALAAAVMPGPKLVLLDEPTNGLDIEGIVMFRSLIRRMSAEEGTSFLISSHMIHELEQLCSRAGIMAGGSLKREGDVCGLVPEGGTLEDFYMTEIRDRGGELQGA
ncbi:ABC transporter ATP-binding protein [Paenibacillus sp. UNC499MF]|uniref:ABC transporter ATP-binding protein n=1 Tax=Paenibacillus sp. UNC499MF TaxID=1502751 RepID=UPI0008A07F33|nr:ABC transporter ATP-binding protein [Paenibacillus sp. UNC499MF]SEG44205.1 ABC-2 type transport system ATP-binding protein [Paenibacillus sp. UNC499MF]